MEDELGACPICGAPGSSCRDVMGPSGIRVVRLDEGEEVPMEKLDRRWWLTADGSRAVPDGDPEAAVLFAAPGVEISRDRALELGIIREDPEPAPAKPKARAGRKQRESVEEAAEDAAEG